MEGFKFLVCFSAFATIQCTVASSMWRIKGLYSAPRPTLEY